VRREHFGHFGDLGVAAESAIVGVRKKERQKRKEERRGTEELGISVCFKIEQRIQTKNTGDNAIKHL
jgi:hypothetical protein